jgi:SAM-dependent methyltransferase
VRAPLARWLRHEALRAHHEYGRFRVLDVGCGKKPYYPFFESFVVDYVGLDVNDSIADVVGRAEQIPLPDDSFEVVLCIQFLEHADDPAAVVRELSRVASPHGRVLASTHGVSVYHPDPIDHWRWTHTGLRVLFKQNGDWRSLRVEPAGGTAACLAMLTSFYLGILGRRTNLSGVAGSLTRVMNLSAEKLDQRHQLGAATRPASLVANYHVTAEAA